MASSRQDPGYEARIASLMNLCVVRYVTNARTINWRRLTTFAAACEQYLRSVKKKKKRKAVRELLKSWKTLGEYATIVRQMYEDPDGRDFFECFRMSRARFDRLLALVAPLLSKQATNADNSISAGERLCAFLRYLAHDSSQRIIAKSYCHSAAFACANVQETSRALRTVLEPLYMPAPTEELWARNAHQFYDLWNFPNCVGAIDGKHITVEARGSATFNYKKTHSIILLAVVDAQYKFVMVDIGEYGSWNDSAVFRSCPIGQMVTSGTLQLPEPHELPHTSVKMPFVLVGDEAFPLVENLMRPYPGTSLTLCEKVYNHRLSRARRIVENAFGILAARWRIFRQIIQAELSTVDNLVWAAVLLHNFLRTCDEEEEAGHARFVYAPPAYVDHEDDSHDVQEGQWRRDVARGKKPQHLH